MSRAGCIRRPPVRGVDAAGSSFPAAGPGGKDRGPLVQAADSCYKGCIRNRKGESRGMSAYRRAVLMNLGAAVVWAVTPVMIRYISAGFPVMFQTFVRYFASLLVLWPLFFTGTSAAERREIREALPRLLPRMAFIALANYAFQASYTASLYLVYPGLAILIYQSAAVFGVLFGFLFFADERRLVRDRRFHAGLLLAVIGVVLTVTGGGSGGSAASPAGVSLVLTSAVSWAFLTVLIKKWLPGVSPFFANAAVISFVTPLFLISHLATGGAAAPITTSPNMWILLLLSGLVGVGLGHSLFYRSVPALGVSLANILQLTRPLFTAFFSFLIFGEVLSPMQIAGGALLIGGAYAVTRLRGIRELKPEA